jgi:putative hydrolase of the HAD superfamily
MRFRAVAFDVDGTLYPNTFMYAASIPFFLSRMRLIMHFRVVRRALRQVRPVEDLYDMQSRMLAESMGVSADDATDIINRRIYRDWEPVLNVVPAFPRVRRSVERLREAGVRVGVLSDFPIGNKLGRLGLEGLWDVRVEAESVGYLKPNPEPFRALLDALGTAPDETLYVGNNYAYDVEGANKLGIRTAHLSVTPRAGSQADVTFYNYRKLADWALDSQKNA